MYNSSIYPQYVNLKISPIFKTITDDVTGSTKSISLFNSSLSTIKKNISSGQGIAYSIFKGNALKQSDIQSIVAFSNALKSGSNLGKAWKENMKGCSVAAKQYVVDSRKAGKSTEEMVSGLKEVPKTTNAATLGMKALTMAGNMVSMWAIDKVIETITTGISKVANESENARESATTLAGSMRNAQNESVKNAQTVASLNDRYQELSKGVNSLGENVSLTSTEYDEYKSIVSLLSDAMPDLTARFNAQGEKIGFVTTQLKDANKEFEEYQRKQALKYLSDGENGNTVDDIIDDYNKSRKGKSVAEQTLDNITTRWNPLVKVDTPEEYEKLNSYQDILGDLQFWKTFETKEDFLKFYGKSAGFKNENLLLDTYNKTGNAKLIEGYIDDLTGMESLTGMTLSDILNDFNGFQEKVSSSVETYKSKLKASLENIKTTMSYMAQSQSSFYDLNDNSKTVFNSIISGLTDESLIGYGIADTQGNVSENKMQDFVNNLLKTFQNNADKIQPQLDGLLKINPVDLDDLSIPKAKKKVNGYISELSKILHLNEADLKTSLGFDSLDTLAEDYEKTINATIGKFNDTDKESLTKFFKKHSINTQKEIDAWNKIKNSVSSAKEAKEQYLTIENSSKILDKYLDAIDKVNNKKITLDSEEYVNATNDVKTAAKAVGMGFNEWISDQVSKNADEIQNKLTNMVSAQETLSTALSEQSSTGTISATTLETLKSKYEGIDKVLETTSNGIIINTTALSQLNKEQQKGISSDLEKDQKALEQQYRNNSIQIAAYNQRLKDKNNLSDEEKKYIENSISALESQQTQIENQVSNLKALDLEYENLVSKHNNFITALNTADAGARYDQIVSGIDKVKEAYKNGDFGKDEIRTFVDYFTDKDMSTASIDEILDEYSGAMEKAEKYFTEDSTGSLNFLDLLKDKGFAEVDADGNWTFNIENFDEIAKRTGLSVDALNDSLMKLKDKGYDIEFPVDESNLVDAQTTVDDLNEKIAKLRQKQSQIESGEIEGNVDEIKNELDALEKRKEELEKQIEAVADEQKKKEDAVNQIKEYYRLSLSGVGSDASSSLQYQMQQIADANGLDLNAVIKTFTEDEEEKDSADQLQEKVDGLNLSTDIAIIAQTEEFVNTINEIKETPYTANVKINVTNPNAIENIVKNYIDNDNNPSKDSDNNENNDKASTSGGVGDWTGSAYAHGNWTVGKKNKRLSYSGSGKALVGELGTELLVRNGEYRTIGENGAELMDIRKDDIIFNHVQTKHLLENGRINSRGKSYARGKAYNNYSKTNDFTKQTFNWIERRVKNFQTKFDRWKNQAEKSATKFIDKYFKNAASNAKKLMNTDSSAYSKYMSKANRIKFSKDEKKYRDKVVKGRINIEDVKDDKDGKLIKKIQNYQDYYDKAQSALDSFADAAEDFYNIPLDKAAVKVEKFNDAIDLLDKKLDNAIGAKAKNKLIDKQTKQQESILNANNKAKEKTDKNVTSTGKALTKSNILNSSDVSKKEKQKIKNAVKKGNEVDLTYFKEGSKAYKTAVKYNEAIRANKKASDEAAKAQEDYNRWMVESAKLKFDNIADDYEKKIQVLGYDTSYNDRKIAEIEASGATVDRSYYEKKSKVNDQIKAQYQDELTTLEKKLGSIKEGTDEWYDAKDAIEACKDGISECTQNTYELNNEINQLHFDNFEKIAEDIERIISEQEFLQGLFAHEKLTNDETGNFTEAGIAKLGSLSASYYASKEKSSKDEFEVKELKRMLDSGSLHSDALGITFNSVDDLKTKLKDMYTQWQDDIKETYSLESSIVDVMKEKYQSELDLLNKLIDDKKTALQTEKDLHDYQRTITEKTNDISTIQKQIAAYSGDTSQEGFAKLQKLQKELADKEEDLRETEYERYISDQEDMLDKLYTEYEELITKKLDDFMALVSEGLNVGNTNTEITKSYLESIMKDFGYTGEFDQNGIFNVASDGSLKDNISKISDRIGTNNTDQTPPSSNPSTSSPDRSDLLFLNGNIYHRNNDGSMKDFANAYIKTYATPHSKAYKEYKAVNKAIYKKTDGNVLSDYHLKSLSDLLGITYNNSSKTGNLYKKLKSLEVSGFAKGGIVSVNDITEQIKNNGDKVLVSANPGEGFLTADNVTQVQNLLDAIPLINNFTDSFIKPDIPNIAPVNHVGNNIEATYNFTLENCNNADDIIRQIQTSPKVQKAIQSVSVDRIAGGGRLNVRNIR